MGLQLGITQIQDKLTSENSTLNAPNPILATQDHNGTQTGPNMGIMVGGMLYNQKYSLGAELRLSHLEYNQTRQLYHQQTNINQNYGSTQTTKINNFSSIFAKFGTFIMSDAMLYGQLGLGVISTKVDYVQSLSNPAIGYQAAQHSHSKKNPGAILGVGLELLVSPHISIYSDFNYSYFPNYHSNANQTIDNITFNFNEDLQQQLFQAVLGIKWHTRKTPKHIDAGLAGWHAGINLGLLQTSLNTMVQNAPSLLSNFMINNRFSSISPDIDVVFGKSWVTKKLALFLEASAAIHPLSQNLNIKYNGETVVDSSARNTATLSLQAKPGLIFYNRILYVIAGMGTTHINVADTSSWYTIYNTGWGLEAPLADKLNIRAEYVFSFSNHTDHMNTNNLEYTNKKLVQQKGTMGLVYYFC
tara:strand:+ start:8771 stop:10015 length:1245 start_codon:yes stop_codon:yes gene_type:complete